MQDMRHFKAKKEKTKIHKIPVLTRIYEKIKGEIEI